ncbi:MAG TPA: hypothetical protein VGS97_17515 [Actinocrinis sp.]|uniref:hypothetical protein n=1 Tax=Actinocrinis sp. TaxID=1920516 RepID=UPI002DDD9B1B|nr:hypothetical protein [Actinocrinis sp.]HEV2345901.1 hypothetical protein [Actinocrinis sp.]
MSNISMRMRIRIRPLSLLAATAAVVVAAAVGGASLQHPGEPDAEEHEAVSFAPNASTGSCGVERWSVKTGTDADSGLINLNMTTNTTIAALGALSAPGSLPSNNRVQPTETTVFRVSATLVEFKMEADSDYHLVLSDGAGHTMIAEIPDPACVGSTSPLTSSVIKARGEFDAKYAVTTSFKTVNVPVTVTGVGFFDFLHGQTGVAPNGIELHSVLDVQFGSGGGGGGCTAAQLLGNPGFETGTAAPWTTSSGVVNNSSSEPPHSGAWDAWLDGYGSTHTDILSQTVTLPSGCATYTLSFWLHIDTAETTTTTAYDTLTVQILNSSGTVLATLATYSNLNHNTGYAQHAFSLASYAGQSVTLKFTGSEDSVDQTSFVLDDIAINVS